MPADITQLLDDAVGTPARIPDFDALAERGRRRRRRQQALQAGIGAAVLVLVGVASLQLLRPPTADVVFDNPPRAGVGTWELIPDAPIEAAEDATAMALDDERVLVLGGSRAGGAGGGSAQVAVFDLGEGAWTRLEDVPFSLGGEGVERAGFVEVERIDGHRVLAWRSWGLPQPAPFVAAVLDTTTGTWTSTGEAPLDARLQPYVGWHADRLVVWGGHVGRSEEPEPGDLEAQVRGVQDAVADGATWSPESGWRPMATFPLAARWGAAIDASADGRLAVWGGAQHDVTDPQHRSFADGAVYDIAADRWEVLPAAPLSPRHDAAILFEEAQLTVGGGTGAVTVTERRGADAGTCAPEPCSSTSFGIELDYERPGDAAIYRPDRGWELLPEPPRADEGAVGMLVEEDGFFAVVDDGRSARLDGEAWIEVDEDPPPSWIEASLKTHVHLGDREVVIDAPPPGLLRGARLGGAIRERDAEDAGWRRLSEADTPSRTGATAAPLGDAVFVWGGTSLRPGASFDDGDPEAWVLHRDGALWRP